MLKTKDFNCRMLALEGGACLPALGRDLPAGPGGVGVPSPPTVCVALSFHGGLSVVVHSGLEVLRAIFSLRWGDAVPVRLSLASREQENLFCSGTQRPPLLSGPGGSQGGHGSPRARSLRAAAGQRGGDRWPPPHLPAACLTPSSALGSGSQAGQSPFLLLL